jgi:hypothetical protein
MSDDEDDYGIPWQKNVQLVIDQNKTI